MVVFLLHLNQRRRRLRRDEEQRNGRRNEAKWTKGEPSKCWLNYNDMTEAVVRLQRSETITFSVHFLNEWISMSRRWRMKKQKMYNFAQQSMLMTFHVVMQWRKFISPTPSTVVNDAHDFVVAFIVWLACWLLCHCLWLLWITLMKHTTNVTNSSICLHILNRNAAE